MRAAESSWKLCQSTFETLLLLQSFPLFLPGGAPFSLFYTLAFVTTFLTTHPRAKIRLQDLGSKLNALLIIKTLIIKYIT